LKVIDYFVYFHSKFHFLDIFFNISPVVLLNLQLTVRHHIAHLRQVSQLKISDFSGEMFKGCEVLYFSMGATMTQLLSSG